MNGRDSLLHWSFPCGTWFATRLRISVYFPLILLLLCFKLGLAVGGVFTILLFGSVLLHEFGHVFAARATGGSGDEILIWPMGGLAFVRPADRLSARLLTSAAGPFVNLVICLLTAYPVYRAGMLGPAAHPFVFPSVSLSSATLVQDLVVLLFVANWLPLIVNLIPVYPLDGGQMLKHVLDHRFGGSGTDIYLRVGFVIAFIGMIAGLMIDSTWLVAIAAIVLVLNIQESVQHRMSDTYDESFMGYDFSEGYTSLERSSDSEPRAVERKPGILQRWRDRRRRKRLERDREREVAEESRLDELLAKVQLNGMDALTEAEQRFLRRTSERYRTKGRSEDA